MNKENHVMRGKARVVAMLENGPRGNDRLHDHLVDGVPQPVQVNALRQQDLVQRRYLADARKVIISMIILYERNTIDFYLLLFHFLNYLSKFDQ